MKVYCLNHWTKTVPYSAGKLSLTKFTLHNTDTSRQPNTLTHQTHNLLACITASNKQFCDQLTIKVLFTSPCTCHSPIYKLFLFCWFLSGLFCFACVIVSLCKVFYRFKHCGCIWNKYLSIYLSKYVTLSKEMEFTHFYYHWFQFSWHFQDFRSVTTNN